MIKDKLIQISESTPNTYQYNILKKYFGEFFNKDESFDFDSFKALLESKDINLYNEGYELNFLGKSYARLQTSTETKTVITPELEHNLHPDNVNSGNVYITGDNLDAIKHLLKCYTGQVKCIYIDPPYNTGKNDFVYPDKFDFSIEELSKNAGIEEDEAQRILKMAGTSSHSAWLTFMYPRLSLARDLLRDDGIIFISIDDNEQANLKLLCDEIFYESNFEGHIHWRRRHNQPNDKTKLIGLVAEHILVYTKNKEAYKQSGVGKVGLTGEFSNPDNDPRGEWASKPWKAGSDQSGSRYTIVTPSGNVLNEEWMGDESTYLEYLRDNRIYFPRSGDGMPRKKYFKFEREEEGQCANNWWNSTEFGHNSGANDEVTELFGFKNVFSNPKPTKLIESIIQLSNAKDDDIILDFFGGSGTTAHSVLKYNATRKDSDGNYGRLRFITVQLPENTDDLLSSASASEKTKLKRVNEYLDAINRPHLLSEVGIARIKLAADKLKSEDVNLNMDYGFKIYNLNHPPQDTLDKVLSFNPAALVRDDDFIDLFKFNNIPAVETIIQTWKVEDGFDFNYSYKEIKIGNYIAYQCDEILYMINKDISSSDIMELVKMLESKIINVSRIVLYGYSFSYSQLDTIKNNIKVLKNISNIKVIERF